MDERRKIGLWGEIFAVRYLRDHGYRICSTNFRVGHLEIDIIAEKDGELCIVEVKTRSVSAILPPSENVDFVKQQNLERAAAATRKIYLPNGRLRFDIIEIIYENRENYSINHIINAF